MIIHQEMFRMEHRGVEFAVVRAISLRQWKWSVERDHNDKVGMAFDRDAAIRLAKKFIDRLIKEREKTKD